MVIYTEVLVRNCERKVIVKFRDVILKELLFHSCDHLAVLTNVCDMVEKTLTLFLV